MQAKVLVTRSSSGRCFRKMHLVLAGTPGGIPCAPRFQGGDVAELDSVILIVAEEATLGLYGVVPFLSDRNTGIASHLRPFRIFHLIPLISCRC